MVVFDFDNTLTNNDTIFGFYRAANDMDIFFQLKRLLFLCVAICAKVNVINNDQLKKMGVMMFLKGKNRDEIKNIARRYASSIELNSIYKKDYLGCPKEYRIIASASYEAYLKELFPENTLLGSQLAYKNQKVVGLKRNLYGKSKRKALKKYGIYNIECLYTDSFSDDPLMKIANEIYLINNDRKEKIK